MSQACDAQSLVNLVPCDFACIPPGMKLDILIALACQIVNNGGTGGGGGSGNPATGVVDPNGNVTAGSGATYYNTANATFWVQTSGTSSNTGWIELI